MNRKAWICFIVCIGIASVAMAQTAKELKMAVGASSSQQIRALFTKIYKDLGYTLTLVELPTPRQITEFEAGNVDAIIFISEAALKAQLTKAIPIGMGTSPLFKYEFFGYVMNENLAKLEARSDVKGVRIGYSQGNKAQEGMLLGLGAVPIPIDNMDSGIKMLALARIDAVMAVAGSTEDAVAANKLTGKISPMKKPLVYSPYFHVLHQKFKDLAPALNKAVHARKTELETMLQ